MGMWSLFGPNKNGLGLQLIALGHYFTSFWGLGKARMKSSSDSSVPPAWPREAAASRRGSQPCPSGTGLQAGHMTVGTITMSVLAPSTPT